MPAVACTKTTTLRMATLTFTPADPIRHRDSLLALNGEYMTWTAIEIEKAYGQNNAILDNCHVRVCFATNDERTARRISESLGTATELRAMKNYAGHRLSPWLGHLMVSRTETARALLTQGEIMQLPDADEIVLLAGAHPIRAKKARYYADPRLSKRIERPPSLESCRPAGGQGDWQDRITAAPEPPARPDTSAAFDEEDAGTEGGVRREPELPEHEDIAPAPRPSRNEFEFEDPLGDEDASRNRRLSEQMRANARRAALDPGDGIEL